MRRLSALAATVLIAYLARSAPPSPPAAQQSLPAVLQKKDWPAWAKPIAFTPPPNKLWQVTSSSRFSTDGMKESLRCLRFQVEQKNRPPEYAGFLLELGRHCLDLDEDALACEPLRALAARPGNTPFQAGVGGFNTLADVIRESHFLLARLYARNSLKAEAEAELKLAPIQNGYDAVRHAEVLAMLGQTNGAVACLQRSSGGGHPDRGLSDFFIRLKAASLARALGRNDLVQTIGHPAVSAGENAQKWPQYKSTWAILNELVRNAKSGGSPAFAAKKDGVYTGSCRGFDAPVSVDVRVAGGRVQSIAVTSQ